MNFLTIIFYLLVVEFILIIIFLGILISCYFYSVHRSVKRTQQRKNVHELILFYLINQKDIKNINFFDSQMLKQDLLTVLESFNTKFTGERWQVIKKAILTKTVLDEARQMTTSSSWVNRNLGVRFLRLMPDIKDEPIILRLLDDHSSMVRIQAAFCAVEIATKPLIKQLVMRLSQESELGRYPYRDALIRSRSSVFNFLEEILKEEKDESIKSICLDVLSTHVNENLFSLIEPYLFSDYLKNKLAAIRALANFPGKESIKYLTQFLQHKDWQIREESAHGLGVLMAKESIFSLAEALNDPVWNVRLQAALALKKMGEEGVIILVTQDPDINLHAYETAKYVLALPN